MQERTDEWRAEREYGAVAGPTGNAARGPDTRTDQLAKLADMRDRGVLSPQEFEREKARLLSSQ
jgi:hypothetical protein